MLMLTTLLGIIMILMMVFVVVGLCVVLWGVVEGVGSAVLYARQYYRENLHKQPPDKLLVRIALWRCRSDKPFIFGSKKVW